MKELVEVIAKALVDNPDEVVVTESEKKKRSSSSSKGCPDRYGKGDRKAGKDRESHPLRCEGGFFQDG